MATGRLIAILVERDYPDVRVAKIVANPICTAEAAIQRRLTLPL